MKHLVWLGQTVKHTCDTRYPLNGDICFNSVGIPGRVTLFYPSHNKIHDRHTTHGRQRSQGFSPQLDESNLQHLKRNFWKIA